MKKKIFGLLICCLLVTACSDSKENVRLEIEPGKGELKSLPIQKLSIFSQENPMFSFYLDEEHQIATLSNNADYFDRWNAILENNCEPYRPNHPSYDKNYIVMATIEDNSLAYYYLRIDSDDNDNIDFVPIEVPQDPGRILYRELGIYRCEGLKELVEEIISQE